MCNILLTELTSDSFVLSAGFLSNPGTARRFLLRCKEIRDIRQALQQGVLAEETLREFVSSLLSDFRVGQGFAHEWALAALAVALERRPTDFAEEFLTDLAKLKLAEMPLCIRVARECLKQRKTLAHNKGKSFQSWPWPDRLSVQRVEPNWLGSPKRIDATGKSFKFEADYAHA